VFLLFSRILSFISLLFFFHPFLFLLSPSSHALIPLAFPLAFLPNTKSPVSCHHWLVHHVAEVFLVYLHSDSVIKQLQKCCFLHSIWNTRYSTVEKQVKCENETFEFGKKNTNSLVRLNIQFAVMSHNLSTTLHQVEMKISISR